MDWLGTLTTVGSVVIGAGLAFVAQELGARRTASREVAAERRSGEREGARALLSDLTALAGKLRRERDAQIARRETSMLTISPDELDALQVNVRLLPSGSREVLLHAIEGLWGAWILSPPQDVPIDTRNLQMSTIAMMQEIVSCFLTGEPVSESVSDRALKLYQLTIGDS
jgi:hypothetical protein